MRLGVVRVLAGVAAVGVSVLVAPAVGNAQVAPPALPPLPPVPQQLNPLLDLLAPTASPTCGTASLLALTASGLLPPSLGASSLLGSGLAPVFIVCGNVPVPDSSTELVCALDDQVFAALSTLTLAAIGSPPPVSTRTVGPVAETVFVIEAQSPAAASLGVASLLASALACRQLHPAAPVSSSPAAPAVAAPDDEGTTPIDDALLPGLDSRFALGGTGTSDALAPTLGGRNVVPAARVGGVHPFAYPFVFVLPLLLLTVGGYLARSLTDDIRFPAP